MSSKSLKPLQSLERIESNGWCDKSSEKKGTRDTGRQYRACAWSESAAIFSRCEKCMSECKYAYTVETRFWQMKNQRASLICETRNDPFSQTRNAS